jgi:hypothetical protein
MSEQETCDKCAGPVYRTYLGAYGDDVRLCTVHSAWRDSALEDMVERIPEAQSIKAGAERFARYLHRSGAIAKWESEENLPGAYDILFSALTDLANHGIRRDITMIAADGTVDYPAYITGADEYVRNLAAGALKRAMRERRSGPSERAKVSRHRDDPGDGSGD